jgi:hypothetical protein
MILNLFKRRNPARELALIGHAKRHSLILSTARLIREEMGMEPDPRLAG